MRYFVFVFLSFLFFTFSCKKNNNTQEIKPPKTGLNTSVKHPKYDLLDDFSNKKVTKWKEYLLTRDFIKQFENISPSEALNNAIELKTLTKQLKDSLNIEILKTPSFKARVNVFENEVLRLADMTYIPSISSNEINNQVAKILTLFGSLNTKINTVYTKKRFDKALKLDSLLNIK